MLRIFLYSAKLKYKIRMAIPGNFIVYVRVYEKV